MDQVLAGAVVEPAEAVDLALEVGLDLKNDIAQRVAFGRTFSGSWSNGPSK